VRLIFGEATSPAWFIAIIVLLLLLFGRPLRTGRPVTWPPNNAIQPTRKPEAD